MSGRAGGDVPHEEERDADGPGVTYDHALRLVALRRFPDALEIVGRGLARHPDDPDLRALLVAALLGADRDAEALEQARALAAERPAWAWPRVQEGWALLALGRPAEAGEAAAAAMRADPEPAGPHVLLAAAAVEREDEHLARRAADEALARDPDEPRAHAILGDLELGAGRPAAAVEHYDAALALDPEAASVHGARGLALRELGRRDDAHAALATAARLDPTRSVARRELAGSVSRELFGVALPAVGVLLLVLGALLLSTGAGGVPGAARAGVVGLLVAAVVAVRARRRLGRLEDRDRRAVEHLGWVGRLRAAFLAPLAEQVPAGWGLVVGGLLAFSVGLAVLTRPPGEELGPTPALAVVGVLIAVLDAVRLRRSARGRSD